MNIKKIVKLHSDYLPYNSLSSEDNVYCELLDKYINNKSVSNIALFGGYGSGKSSIIESYSNSHGEKKTCNVSLAKYNTNGENNKVGTNESNDKKNKYKNVYEEIIKQIFLQAPKNKVLRSKFNYLYNDLFTISFISVIGFTILLLLLVLSKFINFTYLIPIQYRNVTKVLYILFFVILFVIMMYIIVDKNYVNSLKLHNISLDFKLYDENSNLLDKYLSEIIYIFKKSDIQVVFFEDLDRYNDVSIFVELRELNKAINLVLKKYKKSVTFVYAIREDIFDNPYDKFKLFDVSVSIVPYASVYNSYDLLRKEFCKVQEIFDIEISDAVLNTLSYYVQEYRVIKAIINDFMIFYNRINVHSKEIKIYPNSLLYLIVYKNLYTEDFAKVYTHESVIDRILKNIKDNDEYNTLNGIYSYCAQDYSNRKIVKDKLAVSIENEYKYKDKTNFVDFVFSGIFEGYLNDSFGDYVSYIFPVSITENDYNYIMCFKHNDVKETIKYDYSLNDPEIVFKRLHDTDFSNNRILNYTLFEYILKVFKSNLQSNKIKNLSQPLVDSIKNDSEFINKCFDSSENYKELFINIFDSNEKVSELLNYCYIKGEKYSLVFNMFFSLEILVLKRLDVELQKSNISIKRIIEDIENEKIFDNISDKKILEISTTFGVLYNEISKYNFSEYVTKELYNKNRYKINRENILHYCKNTKRCNVSDDDFVSCSEIIELPIIQRYIFASLDNFIIYFDNVWQKRNDYKEDDTSFLELRRFLVNDGARMKILLDNIDFKMKNIRKVDSATIIELLKRNKIEINVSNIQYIFELSMPECIEFINNNMTSILKLEINDTKYKSLNQKIINVIENKEDKLNFILQNANSFDINYIINVLTSINSDIMTEFNEKEEVIINGETKIYAKILEKIGYIKVDDDRRRTSFMKLKKLL